MPRALASSGSNIDDTTASSSDLLQSDTQDSAAQAEVPESRTENDDDLQLETNTYDFSKCSKNNDIGVISTLFLSDDLADDEQTEELTREEFDREDEASSEIAKGGFLDTYILHLSKPKLTPRILIKKNWVILDLSTCPERCCVFQNCKAS
ncbi:hypothetical protein [Parasitella parasitica]|uniref:Uncharacterized protein n=1 Tax=Parasitella parasitica TaxID=35722 RepID=A0A0B7NBT0_9FUNG|nr:hypothetical protein [Parasitella parasitica]